MNLRFKQYEMTINDARGTDMEKNASLDQTGFQFVKHVSKEKKFLDHAQIEKTYYPEIAELLLKSLPGAKKVFIWDHTIRYSDWVFSHTCILITYVRREPKQPEHLDWRTPRGPAVRSLLDSHQIIVFTHTQITVHGDQTFQSSVARVYRYICS